MILAVAPSAAAQDITREQYIARADPLCGKLVKPLHRHAHKGNVAIKRDRLGIAFREISIMAKLVKRNTKKIRAIPRPPADDIRLSNWLLYRDRTAQSLEAVARALRKENLGKATRADNRVDHFDRLADDQIAGMGFRHCGK